MENIKFHKVLDFFVPSAYLLNDNVKNDYRSNMGKMSWLTKQSELAVKECNLPKSERDPKCLCKITPKELLDIDPKNYGLIINHIKIGSKFFDLLNYERTMKPSIDILTSNGYWEDDNCNFLSPAIMIGGCSKSGVRDFCEVLKNDNLTNEEGILEFYSRNISDYWFLHTKYQKISDYDLWQIYVFNN